ncbi:hypothetical protein AMATHDRAFT_8576 [Amanita thiersii Skay4041]|uniref:Uncharacterized protein n=1 Tax=Amanita thiersii Skay4041 TaxID=703135 RepID=A0A2A9NDQ4_9AGAR|nr:hypothetical protein AMATHDRAFT_8576 [Amanita thiersii Skay4041]
MAQNNFTSLYDAINASWQAHSKLGSTKHPTPWWNDVCQQAKDLVRKLPSQQNQQEYQKRIHKARQAFYRVSVQEALTSRKPWKLAKWGNAQPPPAFSTVKMMDDKQVSTLPDLWNCFHNQFNSAMLQNPNRGQNHDEINKYKQKSPRPFYPISRTEIKEALAKTNNRSTPGPDHLTWRHVKYLWNNHDRFCNQFQDSVNWSTQHAFWLSQFKESITIIIPKLNKDDYSTPKQIDHEDFGHATEHGSDPPQNHSPSPSRRHKGILDNRCRL